MDAGNGQRRHLARLRVLVVEDDGLTLLTIQKVLEGQVAEIITARDGQEGLFTFARSRPDLLFTDVMMPRMDGLSLIQAARNMRPDILTIAATTFDNNTLLKQALALRVDEYLDKPLNLDLLLDAVDRCGQRLAQRQEAAARQRQQDLMLSGMPFPAMLVDTAALALLSVNPLAEALGLAPGQACQEPFFPPQVRDILAELEVRYYGPARQRGMELTALDRHWSLSWTPVAARTAFFLAMDVTERHQAEEALREAKEDYMSILQNAPLGVYRSTPDGRFLLANERMARIFGFSSAEEFMAPGGVEARTLYADPGIRDGLLRALEDQGWVERYECLNRRKDGSLFWTATSTRAVRDAQGRTRYYEGFIRDVTKLKDLERLKEDVDRVMRHDLKTPLNAVIGFSHLLSEDPALPAEQAGMARIIRESGYRMLDMINLSLDLYKMETGSYHLHPVPLDLVDTMRNILVEARALLSGREVGVRFLDENGPLDRGKVCLALGEELLCHTMLANLLRNAVEASPLGGMVEVRFLDAPDRVRVVLHNRGTVPGEVRERFFEKYVTAGKSQGTGLGTYSARLFARVQGGDIVMSTNQDQGTTTLTVHLPAAPHGSAPSCAMPGAASGANGAQ